ncbi:hypothetical protein AB0H12_17415 [Actinosynnema sp. NPDC023794]
MRAGLAAGDGIVAGVLAGAQTRAERGAEHPAHEYAVRRARLDALMRRADGRGAA